MSLENAPRAILATTILISGLWWLSGLEVGWMLFIPWALSALFFGLPHGAADHVVWASIRQENGRFGPVIARYLLVMIGYAAVWWLLPWLAVIIFLAITTWHWGSADASRSFERAGARPLSTSWIIASLSRGIVPMVAPLAFHADVVLAIVADWSSELTVNQLTVWVPESGFIVAIIVLSQIIWMIIMKRAGASMKVEGLETAIITLLLIAVHPLISVGIYFTFWHAWYHDRRLVAWYANAENGIQSRSKRRDQVIIMIVTLLGMTALVGIMPPDQSTLSVYLIAISILTMPHMMVVWLMDRRDRFLLAV